MRSAAYVFLVLFAVSCAGGEENTVDRTGWYALPNAHARCFRILTRGDQRRLVVLGPGGELDTLATYRIISPSDTARSVKARVTDVPLLDRIAVVSTTHLPYISALGHAASVVGAAHLELVRDTAVLAAQRAIEAESTWVGDKFAIEARALHARDSDARIHGFATLADARALIEDGVPILPLPFKPKAVADA